MACEQKAIKDAYHVLCAQCARAKQVCAKCQEPHAISTAVVSKDVKDENGVVIDVKRLSERSRRTVMRKHESGEVVPESAVKYRADPHMIDDDDEADFSEASADEDAESDLNEDVESDLDEE